MKVINLVAGPGAGKSTTAAGLFNLMKHEKQNVELIHEFAKDATWQKDTTALGDQLYMLGQQEFRQARLRGQVDFVITDSPLILSAIYQKGSLYDYWWMAAAAKGAFKLYDNITFFIERTKDYDPRGRNQTEYEAQTIDLDVMKFLHEEAIHPVHPVKGDVDAPYVIWDIIKKTIKETA